MRHIRHFLGFFVGLLALVAELASYALERASDRLYAAFCRLTQE